MFGGYRIQFCIVLKKNQFMIIDRISTGHFSSKLLVKLNSKLNRLNKKYQITYVGITCDPNKREKKHSSEKQFDCMILIYQSDSERYVKKIEKELIDKNRNALSNKIGGGGGTLPYEYIK